MASSYYPNDVLYPEGPDWDDSDPGQARCRCGAFMKNKPEEIKTAHRTGWPKYDENGNETGEIEEGPEEIEIDYLFVCTRCGESYQVPPNWE